MNDHGEVHPYPSERPDLWLRPGVPVPVQPGLVPVAEGPASWPPAAPAQPEVWASTATRPAMQNDSKRWGTPWSAAITTIVLCAAFLELLAGAWFIVIDLQWNGEEFNGLGTYIGAMIMLLVAGIHLPWFGYLWLRRRWMFYTGLMVSTAFSFTLVLWWINYQM